MIAVKASNANSPGDNSNSNKIYNNNNKNGNTNNNTDSLEDAVQFLLFHPLPGVEVEAERARKDYGVLQIKCLSDWWYLLATR